MHTPTYYTSLINELMYINNHSTALYNTWQTHGMWANNTGLHNYSFS